MTDKNLIKQKIAQSKGFASIFLIALLPVIIYGTIYLTKYAKKSDIDTSNFEIPYVIGKNLANAFNPGKTWNEQEAYLYSIAAQTYNDEFSDTSKQIPFTPSKIHKVKVFGTSSSITSLYDFYQKYCSYGIKKGSETFVNKSAIFVDRKPISDFIYDETKKLGQYCKYATSNDKPVIYSAGEYQKNTNRLRLSFDNKGQINVSCKELKREATVSLPRNDVDIVIAIPTNRASNTTSNSNTASFGTYTNLATANSTPIKQIARSCQSFLKYFLHTVGVAVGIVPYSGKVTMSPYSDYRNYTTQISMNSIQSALPYVVQSMFYASDGKAGGDIIAQNPNEVASSYGDYANWGSSTIGLPIMARRGRLQTYRGMILNSGASQKIGLESLLLDMTTSPTAGNDYKFMQMNTNPCYLGFCNTLAMTCEKDCPHYMANPYFMSGLTSDIQNTINDLELFVPFKDEKNKSNFLFLPVVMAGNMFSWGEHPSKLSTTGRIKEEPRKNKTRVLIVIANAPDNFEPQEMTYLGFNNDYSEIPMIESDTILFNKDRGYAYDSSSKKYKGVKGAVYFSSNSGKLDTSKGYIFNGDSTARISFPNKGVLKIVTARDDAATIKVYNDNGVTDNVGDPITFIGTKTLNFRGPQQVNNYYDQGMKFQQGYYTTKGPNFGHNLSTKKVKIKFSECKLKTATLSNQILRFYGTYYRETNKSLIENTSGSVWSNAPTNMKKRMDPCITSAENYNDSTNGWLFSSDSAIDGYSRYYISAYGFKPTCYGVKRLNRFIAAAGNFPTDGSLVPDNAQIKYGSNWRTIGNIKYDTSSGIKYRCYTDVYNYPSNNENYIQISTGQFKINSYYYWKLFDSRKYRTRTVDQVINTIRTFYTSSSSSSSSKCCAQVWAKREVSYDCMGRCDRTYTGTCYDYYTDTCYDYYTDTCTDPGHWSSGQALRTYFSGSSTEKARCWSNVGSDGVVGQCYDACPESNTYCKLCDSVKGEGSKRYYDCRIGTGSSRTKWVDVRLWVPERSYSCTKTRSYSCTKTRSYSCTKHETYSCPTTCNRTENYVAGYNEDLNCGGVFWKHHISSVPSGWTLYNSYKHVSCSTYTPITEYIATYRTNQGQYGDCSYSEGTTGNSSCSYPSISTPSIANFEYVQYFGCSRSGTSCLSSRTGSGINRTVGNWNERTTMQKRFYGFYKRNPDGSTQSPTFQICDTNGNNCVSTSYSGPTSLSSTGTIDNSKTKTSPFRYNLYNFFFVSGDGNKVSTYSYSGNNLTSKISKDSYSDLINNKGIYLMPVSGEANTYWVCFCGDGDLKLDFEDVYDSYSVTFSNINTSNERISFDNSGEISEATGVLKNTINAQQTFYILPEQIKDRFDADGNYYIDMKMTGHTRIISVELTNRPLKSFPDARQDPNATLEIVGADSSGGKLTGDNDFIEVKTNRKISFSVKAEPVYFWIEGQSDFRQTSGTARICGNSNKSSVIVNASVPNSGSGKITLESGQISSSRKTSDTGVYITEVTPNYSYTITSDRKLKSINVPSFIVPKVSLSGNVSSKSYTFCARETGNNANQKLFDWASWSMTHSSGSNYNNFGKKTFYGTTKKLNFNLTACELKSANIYDMSMIFSTTINDFPSVDVISYYTSGDPIFYNSNYGYYIDHRTICCYGLYFQFPSVYNTYGSGTIMATAYKQSGAPTLTLIVGGSSKSTSSTGNYSLSGVCNNSASAVAKLSEGGSRGGKWNYLTSVEYKIDSYNLMNKVVYYSRNTTLHNYSGFIPFHGIGNIRFYVQPKKIKTSNYSRTMSESEISGTFGNYKYNFSETNCLLNLDNEALTSGKGSFSPLYSNGNIGSTTIPLGGSGTYRTKPSNLSNGYYYSDVYASNVVLGLSSSLVYAVGTQYLSAPRQGVHSIEEVTISPSTYEFKQRSDGYFYVKIPCRNVYVSSAQFISTSTIKAFAHPNIIQENLINTRIIDGYDRATYQNMNKYGSINYHNSSLPSVSPIQRLFYYSKPNNNTVYLYPRSSGSGSAFTGEEGDFFIQLWDHNNEIPAVRWKIGSSIQSSTHDILIKSSGFGAFKSNYAFNGLHRMFFPYDIYNKDYAGYSYALNTAFVFAGYTLPINLILANNGYQPVFKVSSSYISSYTRSQTALSNLATNACTRLKRDLSNDQGPPVVFLIKYRTNATLSLESCANYKYTASNEANLTKTLSNIAQMIKQNTQTNILRIDVKNMTQ